MNPDDPPGFIIFCKFCIRFRGFSWENIPAKSILGSLIELSPPPPPPQGCIAPAIANNGLFFWIPLIMFCSCIIPFIHCVCITVVNGIGIIMGIVIPDCWLSDVTMCSLAGAARRRYIIGRGAEGANMRGAPKSSPMGMNIEFPTSKAWNQTKNRDTRMNLEDRLSRSGSMMRWIKRIRAGELSEESEESEKVGDAEGIEQIERGWMDGPFLTRWTQK